MSRIKRSFWKSGSSVFEEVLHKRPSFWKSGSSVFEEVSQIARLPDPDASGPKVVLQDPDTEILYKCAYRILIQVVQKDPHAEILRQRSCTSATGSWYKWSKRILIQWSRRILIQRSCTSGPTRILTQAVQKDPDTEILYKWSYRILIQVVQKDPHTETLRQRFCTSATTGSWYKWSKRILIQRFCVGGPTGFW